jgi:5-methylcytosine-specific restriction protein A
MNDTAVFVGTFSAVPGAPGFELPIFRKKTSDMCLIQLIDYNDNVGDLTHKELAFNGCTTDRDVLAIIGSPAIYAFRAPSGTICVGTQREIQGSLASLIELSALDSLPLLRFRVAAFCNLVDRIALDARAAWAWIKDRSTPWAANAWKLESTIIPEIRRNFAIAMNASGDDVAHIDTVSGGVEATIDGDTLRVTIRLPANGARSLRYLEKFNAEKSLIGRVSTWWPEHAGTTCVVTVERGCRRPSRDGRTPLESAKAFLDDKMFLPALTNPNTPGNVKNIFRHSRTLVSKFDKIGDLIQYIGRFSTARSKQLSLPIVFGQTRFEDICEEFIGIFGEYSGDRLSIGDFVDGKLYSGYTLSIFSRTYVNRSGGIRPVGKVGSHRAVVVSATLSGGRYANEWITDGKILKCYLKSRTIGGRTRYNEEYAENRSIIDSPGIKILVFTRTTPDGWYTYNGIFTNTRVVRESDGTKWFELAKVDRPE